jgi:hypothetical protein
MAEEKNTIIPKDLVKAWIEKTMQREYSFTIYPKDRPFGEKFFSYLKSKEVEYTMVEDKILVKGRDPIKIAKLIIEIEQQGFFIED